VAKMRESTGGAYESRGKFFARVTVAPQKREGVLLPWCTSLDAAKARAVPLQTMVNLLREAGQETWIVKVIELGGPATPEDLAALEGHVADIVKGKIVPKAVASKDGPMTFEKFGRQWTGGDLRALYPDDIKEKRTVDVDRLRLEKLYATIGAIPIVAFGLQHAQAAMRELPEGLEVNTRRHYAQLIHRVLAMAVYPACIIKHSPLPRGFLPKPGKPKAKALPYPSEDATGLACTTWPLEYRMLFGFLPREGMRTSEACGLTWGDLSLDVGAVRLDVNKTDHARAWAMHPGVAKALTLWKTMRKDTKAGDFVFKRPDGTQHDTDRLAVVYRDYLEKACHVRPEILKKGTNRMRARAHDLRGMFATYSLANGKTESWCQDRGGWTTSQMVNRYRQASRMVDELGLGDLVPLVDAIPELAAANAAANAAAEADKQSAESEVSDEKCTGGESNPYASRRWNLNAPGSETVEESRDVTAALNDVGGPSNGLPPRSAAASIDAVEAALAKAIEGATVAGRWDVVSQLTKELEARRLAKG
jgi:integrase